MSQFRVLGLALLGQTWSPTLWELLQKSPTKSNLERQTQTKVLGKLDVKCQEEQIQRASGVTGV